MIYLIDEDMPRSSTKLMGEKGYEVLDVRDIGLRGASDKEIFKQGKAAGTVPFAFFKRHLGREIVLMKLSDY